MRPIAEPPLTPDERCSEVAAIFATAILWLHLRAAPPSDDAHPTEENPADSASSCLEVSRKTVLSVQGG
jgi:hypothetical protein